MEGTVTASKPREIYLKDYQAPRYLISAAELTFELHETATIVRSRLQMARNTAGATGPLELDGEDVKLLSIAIDGRRLSESEYRLGDHKLSVDQVPERFVLEVETEINPKANTSLEGLYVSNGIFTTQCEAMGFRHMTYFVDRPDNMATFKVTLVADKIKCPVLLSNGNLLEQRDLENGRHLARWEDPFKKPCYLFALVAGDLKHIADHFVTCSGRKVTLRIYSEAHNADKLDFAMGALKRAMAWDEQAYGCEYDLEVFNIVAVDHFNFGAMENKSLNIFNSRALLASGETTTDVRYEHIEAVVAHEYFHNWSGDRVTCRDWFQLSLKEGFTVFRDSCFTQDMTSWTVKRIADVRDLRATQFPEDSGPMAHPIRPAQVITIENFYTPTVYEKGAEVIRMIHTLLGSEKFRKGSDLYFKRHDGQAVTCDDFVQAMQDASGVDLTQFKLWYSQAGTPQVQAQWQYKAAARTFTLTLKQSCPATPGQPHKQPFYMPINIGLLDADGKDLPLQLKGESAPGSGTRVLHLTQAEQSFEFINVPVKPVPSLLRDFSAPVKLAVPYSNAQLTFLMSHDSNEFNRWEAMQQLATGILLSNLAEHQKGRPMQVSADFIVAFKKLLLNPALDRQFLALALALPSEDYLAELIDEVDPVAIHETRQFVRRSLAQALRSEFEMLYRQHQTQGPYQYEKKQVGLRALKNICLAYLASLKDAEAIQLCVDQYRAADNMTDAMAALANLNQMDCAQRRELLENFYQRWKLDPNVVVNWFALLASAEVPTALAEVKTLFGHEAFDIKNANHVRATLGSFAANIYFHAGDGSGYSFLADKIIEFNAKNPKVAAGLAKQFAQYRRYTPERRGQIKPQLERAFAMPGICDEVYEVLKNTLEN